MSKGQRTRLEDVWPRVIRDRTTRFGYSKAETKKDTREGGDGQLRDEDCDGRYLSHLRPCLSLFNPAPVDWMTATAMSGYGKRERLPR